MEFIADLHLHSKHSRATSRDMIPETMAAWAQLKGISVIGTGDFTHPLWIGELREKLEPSGNGLFRLKKKFTGNRVPSSCKADVFFMLTAEISCIYRKKDRTRKIHALVFVPDLPSAEQLNAALSAIGNIVSDGRPILGLDARELLRMVLDIPGALFVPAHAWTPHFSVFGAASGFDSLEECFEDLTPHIYALETGLSSDPAMNRRLSALDRLTLISNSDAHSPAKIGREANLFDTELSYDAMMGAIRTKQGFAGTIEFFPEEGKYHHDGHASCAVRLSPEETRTAGGRCPSCGKNVTIGVLHRVDELADRKIGLQPADAPPFRSLIPLQELLAGVLQKGVNTKAVTGRYFLLLEKLGNELEILTRVPTGAIAETGLPLLAEAVRRMRSGEVHIAPGYDGVYGKISVFDND